MKNCLFYAHEKTEMIFHLVSGPSRQEKLSFFRDIFIK